MYKENFLYKKFNLLGSSWKSHQVVTLMTFRLNESEETLKVIDLKTSLISLETTN